MPGLYGEWEWYPEYDPDERSWEEEDAAEQAELEQGRRGPRPVVPLGIWSKHTQKGSE